ncbi:hypothetical protein [Cerasicoccus frondis]|uniref:hypothetical protein n=1 Tax=Cerasicoccus frondis TaxID=490090 RepID=UPI002852515D|nr:hypothetical protein [Cerasicoccus frondis]
MKNPLLVSLAAWSLSILALSADITIDNFTDATNDRFTNDDAFIADAYNLSAIGKSGARWGTLVSSNVILCANHYHPLVGNSITFYASNDATGASETRTVSAGERIGETDLWVGVLNEPLPVEYEPLPFMTNNVQNDAAFLSSGLYNQQMFLVGVSASSPNVALDTAIGQNRIAGYELDYEVPGKSSEQDATGDAIFTIQNSSGQIGYLTYEAQLEDQDSGAPMLQVRSGELTIIGINWFIGSTGANRVSGATYVGNYDAEIQAIIDAYDGLSVPSGYGAWAATAFGSTDISQYPPDEDSDDDGLDNYNEYALAKDPLTYDAGATGSIDTTTVSGSEYAQLSITLQQNDDDLNYTVQTGGDPANLTAATLSYSGGWSVGNSAVATIASSVNNGDSTWTLTLRDASSMLPGVARFMRIGYDD